MKISREIRIILFVAAAAAIVIFGIGVLQGRSIFARSFLIHAYFDDVDNLTAGGKVLVNGYQVGQVKSLDYEVDQRRVKVIFDLVKDIPVPVDSRALLADLDFFGSKCIRLQLGRSQQAIESGGRLSGSIEEGMIDKLGGKVDPLASRVDTILVDLQAISRAIRQTVQDSSNRANRILRNVETTTQELSKLTQDFGKTARRVDALAADLQAMASQIKQGGQVERVLNNSAKLSDSLVVTAAKVRQVVEAARGTTEELKTILLKVNQGEGTAGQLLNNRQLYDNLDRSTRNLDSLVVDLKKRPWRYVNFSVFGKKPKE